MQDAGIWKGEKWLSRLPVIALGWILVVGGMLGLFLPVLPGVVLIAAGVLLLGSRYTWVREMIDKCQARFPGLAGGFSNMERAEQQDLGEPQALFGTRKALIFDENIDELAIYSQPFEAQGVEVHKCASIESAMRCVEREQFDFALVDQVSPAFEGRRVIRHLVRYNWPIPFVVMTEDKDMQCFSEALEFGAAECLKKPVPAAELNGIIHRFLVNRPKICR